MLSSIYQAWSLWHKLYVNIIQAGSGEESEEEEDDSDGEEGPRGRMCTQS